MTPSEALVWVLVLVPLYVALVAYLTLKEYRPMSDRLSRAARTFVQAFLGTLLPLVASKLAGIDELGDLSGLTTVIVPLVVAAVSAGASAAMGVLFPPAAPVAE